MNGKKMCFWCQMPLLHWHIICKFVWLEAPITFNVFLSDSDHFFCCWFCKNYHYIISKNYKCPQWEIKSFDNDIEYFVVHDLDTIRSILLLLYVDVTWRRDSWRRQFWSVIFSHFLHPRRIVTDLNFISYWHIQLV